MITKERNLRSAIGAEAFDRAMQGLGQQSPIPSAVLQLLQNVPAEACSEGSYTTRAARTLHLSGLKEKDIAPQFKPSKLAEGAWEVDEATIEFEGIPGRHAHCHDAAATASTRSKNRDKKPSTLDGFIPETEAISLHPMVAFASRHSRVTTRADGRKFRASADDPHVQIYNNDDRVFIYPDGYPLRCVCKLEIRTQAVRGGPWILEGQATGFLAGRSVCVTSGHVAPRQPNAGWMIKVTPGMWAGRSVLGPAFYTYVHSYHAYNSDVGNDIMVMGLYDPLGERAGFFGLKSYDDDWEDLNVWAMCGYHFDRSLLAASYQGGIAVYDDDDGDDVILPNGAQVDSTQIETYADESSGASGSPLFSWFGNGNVYAVGVHHGRELVDYGLGEDRNSVASGGDILPTLVGWARAEWP